MKIDGNPLCDPGYGGTNLELVVRQDDHVRFISVKAGGSFWRIDIVGL